MYILYFFAIQNVAHVEAVIDFGEDENIEEGLLDQGCHSYSHPPIFGFVTKNWTVGMT